jgi:hypothetical protein
MLTPMSFSTSPLKRMFVPGFVVTMRLPAWAGSTQGAVASPSGVSHTMRQRDCGGTVSGLSDKSWPPGNRRRSNSPAVGRPREAPPPATSELPYSSLPQLWAFWTDGEAGRFGIDVGQSVADDGFPSADFEASANARSKSLLLPPR